MTPMVAVAEVSVFPVLAAGAVLITMLRLNGWLNEEVIAELQKPLSRTTLVVVAFLTAMVGHFYWIASHF